LQRLEPCCECTRKIDPDVGRLLFPLTELSRGCGSDNVGQ
jgi:hypothetical protein